MIQHVGLNVKKNQLLSGLWVGEASCMNMILALVEASNNLQIQVSKSKAVVIQSLFPYKLQKKNKYVSLMQLFVNDVSVCMLLNNPAKQIFWIIPGTLFA